MFYEYDVVVPPNTPASAPVVVTALLTAGTLTNVSVQLPRGCQGLVHAYVQDKLHRVVPANQDGDIKGDDIVVPASEEYQVPTDDYELELAAYNLDDTYTHTVTFRLDVLPASRAAEQQSALNALLYLDKWFSQQTGAPAQQGGG